MPHGPAGTQLRIKQDKSQITPQIKGTALPHLLPQTPTSDLPTMCKKPGAGPAKAITYQAHPDLRAQALPHSIAQHCSTLPNAI